MTKYHFIDHEGFASCVLFESVEEMKEYINELCASRPDLWGDASRFMLYCIDTESNKYSFIGYVNNHALDSIIKFI